MNNRCSDFPRFVQHANKQFSKAGAEMEKNKLNKNKAVQKLCISVHPSELDLEYDSVINNQIG